MVVLFDQFNLPDDVFEVIFSTEQQIVVAKVLINFLKANKGEVNKTEMSWLANQLHEGKYETEIKMRGYEGKKVRLAYNKRQFYDRILTPMKSMGIIKYDLYKKNYALSEQFNKMMIKIGMMWLNELKKPAV